MVLLNKYDVHAQYRPSVRRGVAMGRTISHLAVAMVFFTKKVCFRFKDENKLSQMIPEKDFAVFRSKK